MQILIPMAGAGSRFNAGGFDVPKPFIRFCNAAMIEHVVANLGIDNQFILITQTEHHLAYQNAFTAIDYKIGHYNSHLSNKQKGSLKIVDIDTMTQGAAETCLLAKDLLDLTKPVMIANSDQIMDWNQKEFKSWFLDSGLDGAMLTFNSQSPKNSYAEVNKDGLVIRTAEKEVISKHATNGIYVWRRARDFIDAAKEMIMLDHRVNGEFYVCPCYNRNIVWGQKIGIYQIEKHWPVGDPQSLVEYLDHLIGQK